MKVLYVCPFAHLTGHPPFECTKETRIMAEHGIDVELLTFCGVHEGFEVSVPQRIVMRDNRLFRLMRSRFVSQWILRVLEYASTVIHAMSIAGDRTLYLRDAEPFPHLVHIFNTVARKRWVISSTGGLFTTGQGVSPIYKALLKMTTVNWPAWYHLSASHIRYSVQNQSTLHLMRPLLGDNITVVPLGHKMTPKVDRNEARRTLGIPNDAIVLLVLGVNHSGKNSRVIFESLVDMKGITLIHAGPSFQSAGDKPEQLEAQYKIGARVLNRQIGNAEKALLFGASDWAVLSYNTSFASTTSMLWEAAAYGVPVVASSGNELEKMVKQWGLGLVFEAGNADDLKLHIELARSNALRDSFAENCRDFINFYSEDKWLEKTVDLLQSWQAEALTRSRTQVTSHTSD